MTKTTQQRMPPTEPGLVGARMERLGGVLSGALVSLRDELPDAIRTLKALSGQLDAWERVARCVEGGGESPEVIATLVEEEVGAVREICNILGIPKTTRPCYVAERVKSLKKAERVLALNYEALPTDPAKSQEIP